MSWTKKAMGLDGDELPEPPAEAYSNEDKREINDDWLAVASEDDQVAAMVQWFHARFWDPANDTPYMSSEGGYIWTRGGPYDASEQLEGRFSGIASDDAIQEAVDSVQSSGIFDWAPTQLTYYDEAQDVFVDERNAPTQRLEERLDKLMVVLDLQGNEQARETARYLTYAAVISALETFLWETMAYWVEEDAKTIVNLITKLPFFRDQQMKLGDIYARSESLKAQVRAHLQRVVWHRWDQVGPILRLGLEIELPDFDTFDDPIKWRHDIVHRSGQDKDRNPIAITDDQVRTLATLVLEFANDLDERIASGPTSATASDGS